MAASNQQSPSSPCLMLSASHQNRTQKYRNHNRIINPHINQTKQSASITEKSLAFLGFTTFQAELVMQKGAYQKEPPALALTMSHRTCAYIQIV
jgi:hypothetical protein